MALFIVLIKAAGCSLQGLNAAAAGGRAFAVLLCMQDQLSISELCLDWEALQDKLEATPELFQTTIWPALTAVGWQYAAQDTAAATSSDAGILPAAANEQQQQPISPVTATPAGSGTITDGSQQQHFYVPPATVSAAYLASGGEPLQPCSSWQDVLTALQDAAQPVPPGLVSSLRQAELGEAQQACLQPPAADAPHRCVHDPSNKRPGTPLTSRKLVSDGQHGSSSMCKAGI